MLDGCDKHCTFKIPIDDLMLQRIKYFKLDERSKLQFIFDHLSSNQIKTVSLPEDIPIRFHICGVDVCKKCWKNVYHISKEKFQHAYECYLKDFIGPHKNSSSMNSKVS